MTDTETSDFAEEAPVSENRTTPKYPSGNSVPPLPAAVAASKVAYMEARIASIEAHVDHMRDDLGDMRRDYRELTKTIVTALGGDIRVTSDSGGTRFEVRLAAARDAAQPTAS